MSVRKCESCSWWKNNSFDGNCFTCFAENEDHAILPHGTNWVPIGCLWVKEEI